MSSFLLPLIAGERYQPAVIPFAILLVGVAFNGIGCLYTSITNSFDLVALEVSINVFLMVLNLVGDLLFVPLWGINGAAVAKGGAMALAALLYIPILHRSRHFSRDRRHYLVALWIGPSVVALIGVLAFDTIPLHLSVAVLTSLLFLYLARRCSIIHLEDLAILEKVHMPMLLKVSLRRILLSSASSST
jgi:O-antigen/teichoic acid export membrane protein